MKKNTRNAKGAIYAIGILTLLAIFSAIYFYKGTKSSSSYKAYTENITPTITTSPTVSMSPTPSIPWTKLINTTNSYSIEYPSDIEEQDSSLHHPETAWTVYLDELRVSAGVANDLTLKEYVDREWSKNNEKPNLYLKEKKVGDIEETQIAGRKGYQFTVTRSIDFDGKSESIKGTFVMRYIQNRKNIYIFAYPVNSKKYEQIIDKFKLL